MTALRQPFHAHKPLFTVDYQEGREVRAELPINKVYRALNCKISIDLNKSINPAPAFSNIAQARAMALIKEIQFEINGKNGFHRSSGNALYAAAFQNYGTIPAGFDNSAPQIDAVDQTISMSFSIEFGIMRSVQRPLGVLHLMNLAGATQRIQNAFMTVKWGSINDLFARPEGRIITGARLEVTGEEYEWTEVISPAAVALREYREYEQTYDKNHVDGATKEFELDRVPGSILRGVTAIITRDGVQVDWKDGEVCFSHGTTDFNKPRVATLRAEAQKNFGADNIPPNYLFIDLEEKFDASTGIVDAGLDHKIKIKLPCPNIETLGTADQTPVYRVLLRAEYVTGLQS